MGTITLLKHFTFAGDNQTFFTDWVHFPNEHMNAQLVVIVHSRTSTSAVSVQLQTTWDTATATSAGSSVSAGAPGTSQENITSGMGPMVRLALTGGGANTFMTISVYLTPKSE
jgi:hypothetical protein